LSDDLTSQPIFRILTKALGGKEENKRVRREGGGSWAKFDKMNKVIPGRAHAAFENWTSTIPRDILLQD